MRQLKTLELLISLVTHQSVSHDDVVNASSTKSYDTLLFFLGRQFYQVVALHQLLLCYLKIMNDQLNARLPF